MQKLAIMSASKRSRFDGILATSLNDGDLAACKTVRKTVHWQAKDLSADAVVDAVLRQQLELL